jgi:hypothetical protein
MSHTEPYAKYQQFIEEHVLPAFLGSISDIVRPQHIQYVGPDEWRAEFSIAGTEYLLFGADFLDVPPEIDGYVPLLTRSGQDTYYMVTQSSEPSNNTTFNASMPAGQTNYVYSPIYADTMVLYRRQAPADPKAY